MSGDGWLRGPQWASSATRAEWEDRLAAAALAWQELEVLTVSAGLRPSALIYLTPDELVRATAGAAGQGLSVVPLASDGGQLRAAVCDPALVGRWLLAWRAEDDAVIGRLLGFPECCIEAFSQTWGAGRRDPTPAMRTQAGPVNILLRRLGVRLVPHLPCSADCERSARQAEAAAAVGLASGIADVAEIERILALPVTWNARAGAAIVDVAGLLRFVYETDSGRLTTRERDGIVPVLEPPTWRDNGFSSRAAMEVAHGALLAKLGPVAGSLVDLGCGDAALLARVPGGGRRLGVEIDEGRAARARARHPEVEVVTAPIAEWVRAGGRHDVALISAARLAEDPALRDALPAVAAQAFVYSYDRRS